MISFLVAFILSYWAESRRGRVGLLIKEANLKTVQIRELEKINLELEKQKKTLESKEVELTLANKRLQNLEEAKSKFVSVTTHQLRTPLAAIKWTFNLLLGEQLGKINEEQKSFLQKGFQSTEKMISIVNELLRVDLIEADQTDYHFALFDLDELIEKTVQEFSNQSKSRNIKINYLKPTRKLSQIEGDQDKIRMVLENLIDNAVKYSPNGGEVEVELKDTLTNSASNGIEIVIKDKGIGIPPEESKRLFQKFFRASNAIKQEPDGSGIGLFIARDIILKHNGAIWYEPNRDKGTAFHITLPMRVLYL